MEMIKKISIIIVGLFMFSAVSFAATISSYEYSGCCLRVDYDSVDVKFSDKFEYEYIYSKPKQLYTDCEFLGSCGCLNCDTSRVGVGYNNMQDTYDNKVTYVSSANSRFRAYESYESYRCNR